jgi:3-hydroxyisobutyrate dehydrogenase-like beta-hydroxyacid dehydrogenase
MASTEERGTGYRDVFGVPQPAVDTEFGRVSIERVVDGLWSRPTLDRKERRLLTLAVLASAPNDAALDQHIDAALITGDLSARELEEVAVHLAHYAGWPAGSRFAGAVEAVVRRRRSEWEGRPPVGVVGVGALGGDVARALVSAGADVVVYDVRSEVAAGVEGAAVADSLTALAPSCSVIGIVVRDDAQVLDVVVPLVEAAAPGTTLLIHSTVSLATVRQAHALGAAQDVVVLDVGLCRPAGLESGLVAVVGGEPADVERVAPVLRAIAHRVHHCGPLGSGMATKALRNMAVYAGYATVAEAMDAARASGMDVDVLLAAFADSGASGPAAIAFSDYRAEWLAGLGADATERAGFVELARKDLAIAADLAAGAGTDAGAAASPSSSSTFADDVARAMPSAYLAPPDA